MPKPGNEYQGKLLPGMAETHQAELDKLQEAHRMKILKGVQILSGPGCAVSQAQEGRVYSLRSVPQLPLPGCDRSPCCGCCYQGVVKERF